MSTSEVDLSEFEALNPKGVQCKAVAAIEQLSDEDRVKFEAALAADSARISAGALMAWLRKRGLEASNPALTAHRNGRCACARAR